MESMNLNTLTSDHGAELTFARQFHSIGALKVRLWSVTSYCVDFRKMLDDLKKATNCSFLNRWGANYIRNVQLSVVERQYLSKD